MLLRAVFKWDHTGSALCCLLLLKDCTTLYTNVNKTLGLWNFHLEDVIIADS